MSRLILKPTKAAKLQGDFRTGKKHEEDHPLHRQLVQEGQDLAAAGEVEKETVPGRSTPHSVSSTDSPLSQILVTLDDSSSMSDKRSRSIALHWSASSPGSAPGSPSDTEHCLSWVVISYEDVRDVGGWSL